MFRGRCGTFSFFVRRFISTTSYLNANFSTWAVFEGIFKRANGPLEQTRLKRPIKVGKRPIKAMVLVGISAGCLMGCFRAPPPWRKTAPLQRLIKRSMKIAVKFGTGKGVITKGVFKYSLEECLESLKALKSIL